MFWNLAAFSGVDAANTFSEIRQLLNHEVHFECEQGNMVEATRAFGFLSGVRVPQLIRPLCTKLVTAMTEENGVKATEIPAGEPGLRARVAEQIVAALLMTPLFLKSGLFHADPHAGNLLYDVSRGQLILLDWALTGQLNQEERRYFLLLVLMLSLRDAEGVRRCVSALSGKPVRMESEIRNFIENIPKTRLPGSLDVLRLLDFLALHGIRFPAHLLMFRKMLFTLDGVLHDIAGDDLSLDTMIARYLAVRWTASFGKLPFPLEPSDWATVMESALLYGTRLWTESISHDALL
jgi:ubiquinone biosynthesis protein